MSDVTEDLGQFIAMEVICCIIGGKQNRPVISAIKVTEMLQFVCARSN